uniref:non-specific serine/threonine protein kinase n=1 Tax=Elaeis guineensis var. tenera TaxID=51953 RepID=A0A6J0PHS4_ELAGV|nr:probable LRR receptor-like serine/threonine-protein kinase At3g47570 [Elaeis guineensis]
MTVIQKAKDLIKLSLEELIDSLMTYELNLARKEEEEEPKRKTITFKSTINFEGSDESEEDEEEESEEDDKDIILLSKKFKKARVCMERRRQFAKKKKAIRPPFKAPTMSNSIKVDFEKFNGKDSFSMWKVTVEDLLVQSELDLTLEDRLEDDPLVTTLLYGKETLHYEEVVSVHRPGRERERSKQRGRSKSRKGVIPATIGKLQKLQILCLNENQLTGALPSSLGDLSQLLELHLDRNSLEGGIPSSFGKLQKLLLLDLSHNKLYGSFPKEITNLASLTSYLNLSHNSLIGPLPSEIGRLKNLGTLDLSENNLSGEIPGTLLECQVLQYLYMQGNHFQGAIPTSLSSSNSITVLDLSRNNLSGSIPESFEGCQHLQLLNLSFNDLDGRVPNAGIFLNASLVSVIGNRNLCGENRELDLQTCPNQEFRKPHESHALRVVIITTGIVVPLVVVFLCAIRLRKPRSKISSPLLPLEGNYQKTTFAELARATDGFSAANLIGEGSFGCVYRGVVNFEPKEVAIKLFHHHQRGALKIFQAECRILRSIRHRNLLKILTACSSLDRNGSVFLALVTEFMPNGSLDKWLHPRVDGEEVSHRLTLLQRMSIAIDVASALDYLHHYSGTPIVHCDLKPSNILLDEDMVAHVCDFGLAKFLMRPSGGDSSPTTSHTTGIKGSIGYVAPEYGMGSKVSTQGDVYSYGILLLEMLTGLRPTDDRFKDGLDLHSFVKMAYPQHVMDILDPALLLDEENGINISSCQSAVTASEEAQNCLLSIIKIGLWCAEKLPQQRMKLGDVIKIMHAARETHLRDSLSENPKICPLNNHNASS